MKVEFIKNLEHLVLITFTYVSGCLCRTLTKITQLLSVFVKRKGVGFLSSSSFKAN